VEVRLKEDLSCHLIAASLALFVAEARFPQGGLGFPGAEALVPKSAWQARERREPAAELSSLRGLDALAAAQMDGQADHDLADVVLFDHLLEIAAVLFEIATDVVGQRRGDAALWVADGQAQTHLPMVDAQ